MGDSVAEVVCTLSHGGWRLESYHFMTCNHIIRSSNKAVKIKVKPSLWSFTGL